jgi:hypothetical protein
VTLLVVAGVLVVALVAVVVYAALILGGWDDERMGRE